MCKGETSELLCSHRKLRGQLHHQRDDPEEVMVSIVRLIVDDLCGWIVAAFCSFVRRTVICLAPELLSDVVVFDLSSIASIGEVFKFFF